jgi:hypothetical protein
VLRATMDISAHTFSLAAVRNRWFADSLLEGGGFEPSVPRAKEAEHRLGIRQSRCLASGD